MGSDGLGNTKEQENNVLYILRLLVNSQSIIGFRWSAVYKFIEEVTGFRKEQVKSIIKGYGITVSNGDLDRFQVYGIFSVLPDENGRKLLFSRIIEILQSDKLAEEITLSLSLNYGFSKAIIGILVLRNTRIGKMIQESPLIALCSSDPFLESEEFNQFSRENVSRIDLDGREMEKYLSRRWFVDLVEILNEGFYGTDSFSILQEVQKNWKDEDIEGLEEVMNSGLFLKMLARRSEMLLDKNISESLTIKKSSQKRSRTLRSFYHWLGIGNDFTLGLEFLVGSIEFLPRMNEIDGVILFIIGSIQLTGRAVITIVSDAHLSSRERKLRREM
ncbi:MAG: YrhK family protein [Candidatus Thermoplasmatota archaeon]|nr:YrhK family protein [Candidatus Thermoplasmatota archaeon]